MSMPDLVLSREDVERFWSRVEIADGCWFWLGNRNADGYGRFFVNGGSVLAHRVSFFLATGVLPDEMKVCHTCDTPPCSNPEHLFLGTQADNLRDMAAKGRSSKRSNAGESNANARLSVEQVCAIRALPDLAYGERSRLAEQFGVSPHAIWAARTGRAWKTAA